MPYFTYAARDGEGNTVNGCLEALDERDAASQIRGQGMFPSRIQQTKAPVQMVRGIGFWRRLISPLYTGINIRTLLYTFRQLATMIKAGMTLRESLDTMSRRSRGMMSIILRDCCHAVEGGRTMSSVLDQYPRVFPPLVISLIRAGERGGLMEEMLEQIVSHLEYELLVRREIVGAMFYPSMVLVAAIVIPHAPIWVTYNFTAFAKAIWQSVGGWLPYAVGLLVVFKLMASFEWYRRLWDRIKLWPPILGTTARKIALSRFSRSMAALFRAGVPISETIEVAADSSGNAFLAQRIKFALPAIRSGASMTETLSRTGVLTREVQDMLHTGEVTGSLDNTLDKVSEYMDNETRVTLQRVAILLFITMLVMAGIFVGWVAMRAYGGDYLDQIREYLNQN